MADSRLEIHFIESDDARLNIEKEIARPGPATGF